jgi:hypothetical protein
MMEIPELVEHGIDGFSRITEKQKKIHVIRVPLTHAFLLPLREIDINDFE